MISILRASLGISAKAFSERNTLSPNTSLKNTGARDVVTELDLVIHKKLVEFFESHGIPSLSEESCCNSALEGDTFAIIDPLDGTLNYFFSLPAYCTVVGIVENGKLICGGLASHSDGVTAYSNAMAVFYSRRYRLPVLSATVIPASVLAYGPLLSDSSKTIVNDILQLDARCFPGFHRIGSAAQGALQFASGRFSSMVCLNVRVWDIAGIIPILLSLPEVRSFILASESSVSLLSIKSDAPYFDSFFGIAERNGYEALDSMAVSAMLQNVIFNHRTN